MNNMEKVFGNNTMGKSGASMFSMPKSVTDKSRKFPGASKKSYGPAMNGALVPNNFGENGFTNSVDGSSGGDSGAGAVVASIDGGDDKVKKFKSFVESFRTNNNSNVIDTVLEGFSTIVSK